MGRVNLIAVPSAVQSGYAPKGKHLLAVSLKPSFSEKVGSDVARNEILTEVENLLKQPLNAQFIQSIEVPCALPSNTPYLYDFGSDTTNELTTHENAKNANVFCAGAKIANPSLNAAILSGLAFADTRVAQ